MPNQNDTLGGRVNRFIATVGGETVDNFLNATSPVAEASLQGLLAFADGGMNMIPGIDFTPFEDWGFYDSSQLGLGGSQLIGSLTRDAALILTGASGWTTGKLFGFRLPGVGTASVSDGLLLSSFGITPLSVISAGGNVGTLSFRASTLFTTGSRIKAVSETYNYFFSPDE